MKTRRQFSLSTLLILTLTISALIGLNFPRENKVVNVGVGLRDDFWRVKVSDESPMEGTIADHSRDDAFFVSESLPSAGWPFRIHPEWEQKLGWRYSCEDGPLWVSLTPELTRVFRTLKTEPFLPTRPQCLINERIDYQALATQTPEFLKFVQPVVDDGREIVPAASLNVWAANILVALLICMSAWALSGYVDRLYLRRK